MSKIIKENKGFEARCIKCGTIFEYEFDDLDYGVDSNGYNNEKLCVKCPSCGLPVYNIWHNKNLKNNDFYNKIKLFGKDY